VENRYFLFYFHNPTMAPSTSLQSSYPWTSTPFTANAPMGGFANSALAIAVTQAKGFGFIGAVFDLIALATELEKTSMALLGTEIPESNSTLPVGVGFLPFVAKLEDAASVIAKFRPAAVWLFAAHELEDYAMWAQRMREVSPLTKIWIQIGSVAGALRVAELVKPDVIVMQGLDAGGHGWEKGAGIISLLPEAADVLAENDFGHISLLAGGGIVDGRGIAAALALGAEGIVMGTRFLSALETTVPHKGYREAILATKDGGQNTVRAKIFDKLRGPNIWPVLFDGRGVVTDSYTDHVNGMDIEEIRRLHAEAAKAEDAGFGPGNKRTTVWAGTGIGLVNDVKGAKDIVEEVREGARAAMERAKARL
jgi:nitronate monooxygenase